MLRSLYIGATGMIAQQLSLDVVANNLANANTTGYKKGRADFQDLMYQIVQEPGTTANQAGTGPTGIQVGLGVRPAAVGKIFTQGDFQSTNNPLDVAIEGDGFFQITLPNGESAYTRSGAFKINEDGYLTTAEGYLVEPNIALPADTLEITISAAGTVAVSQPNSSALNTVGELQVARFQNPAGLRAIGKNLFQETESSGAPTLAVPGEEGSGTLAQRFLEGSNVSVVEEVVQMVTSQRAYEANSKVIQTADQILQLALNLKRS
jgi:flagellar basal-body rod protein FlgG